MVKTTSFKKNGEGYKCVSTINHGGLHHFHKIKNKKTTKERKQTKEPLSFLFFLSFFLFFLPFSLSLSFFLFFFLPPEFLLATSFSFISIYSKEITSPLPPFFMPFLLGYLQPRLEWNNGEGSMVKTTINWAVCSGKVSVGQLA